MRDRSADEFKELKAGGAYTTGAATVELGLEKVCTIFFCGGAPIDELELSCDRGCLPRAEALTDEGLDELVGGSVRGGGIVDDEAGTTSAMEV